MKKNNRNKFSSKNMMKDDDDKYIEKKKKQPIVEVIKPVEEKKKPVDKKQPVKEEKKTISKNTLEFYSQKKEEKKPTKRVVEFQNRKNPNLRKVTPDIGKITKVAKELGYNYSNDDIEEMINNGTCPFNENIPMCPVLVKILKINRNIEELVEAVKNLDGKLMVDCIEFTPKQIARIRDKLDGYIPNILVLNYIEMSLMAYIYHGKKKHDHNEKYLQELYTIEESYIVGPDHKSGITFLQKLYELDNEHCGTKILTLIMILQNIMKNEIIECEEDEDRRSILSDVMSTYTVNDIYEDIIKDYPGKYSVLTSSKTDLEEVYLDEFNNYMKNEETIKNRRGIVKFIETLSFMVTDKFGAELQVGQTYEQKCEGDPYIEFANKEYLTNSSFIGIFGTVGIFNFSQMKSLDHILSNKVRIMSSEKTVGRLKVDKSELKFFGCSPKMVEKRLKDDVFIQSPQVLQKLMMLSLYIGDYVRINDFVKYFGEKNYIHEPQEPKTVETKYYTDYNTTEFPGKEKPHHIIDDEGFTTTIKKKGRSYN